MKTVNAFLIQGEYNTLIDCGEKTEASWAALEEGLKQYGITVSDIDKVVITHAHVDHIGMARRIAEKSGAKIHVSDLVYDWAVNLEHEWASRNEVMKNTFSDQLTQEQKDTFIPIFKSFFGQVTKHWDPLEDEHVEVFEHSSKIDLSGEIYHSIHCPGHTFTQTCFYNETNADFLSADMLLRITPTCVIEYDTGNKGKRNKSMPQLIASFNKLRAMEIGNIYPGHYEIMDNHIALIDRQIERINMRKNQVLDLIRSGTNRYFDLFNALYSGRLNFPGLVMVLGYLDSLEAEKRIKNILTQDGIIYEERI